MPAVQAVRSLVVANHRYRALKKMGVPPMLRSSEINCCNGCSLSGFRAYNRADFLLVANINLLSFVWFDHPGESSPEKDCCW